MKVSRENKSNLLQSLLQKGGWTLLSFSFLILLWIVIAGVVGNAYLLPSVSQTLKACFKLCGQISFWSGYFATLTRAVFAFLVSIILAGGLCVLACVRPSFGKFIAPIFSLLRSLPTMAVLLMIILWTSADFAPIVVSCLVLLPMLYSATLSAITAVDEELIEMSRVYRVSKKRMIQSLYLPSVFPALSREALSALTFSLKLTVSAEILSNTFQSLGGQMQSASLYAQTPTVFALAFVVFLTGFAIECLGNFLILRIERRFL